MGTVGPRVIDRLSLMGAHSSHNEGAYIIIMSWLTVALLILGPGFVATILCSPLLAFGRLRSLFRQLPLSESTIVNYVISAIVLSIPWLVGFAFAFNSIGTLADTGTPRGEPLFVATIVLSAGYIVGIPLVVGLWFPRYGFDWDENGYDRSTWLVLIASSAWYTSIYAVPAFVMGIIVELPH